MATAEEILVRIEGDVRGLKRALKEAEGQSRQAGNKLERNLRKAFDNIRDSVDRTAKRIVRFGALAGGAAVIGAAIAVVRLEDKYRSLEGRLKLVTDGSQELEKVMSGLTKASLENGTSLEAALTIYQRLGLATKQLNLQSDDLLGITEGLQKAFVVSGATAQEARNALIQLSQGLSSGQLRGEEFRSVAEQGTRILQALERQLGKTRGELIEMAFAGEITTETFIQAFQKELPKINEEFEKMPDTVGRAIERIRASLLSLVGGSEEASEAQDNLIMALNNLANFLNSPEAAQGFGNLVTFFTNVVSGAAKGINAIANFQDIVDNLALQGKDLITASLFGDESAMEDIIQRRIDAVGDFEVAWKDLADATGDSFGMIMRAVQDGTGDIIDELDIAGRINFANALAEESGGAEKALKMVNEDLNEITALLTIMESKPGIFPSGAQEELLALQASLNTMKATLEGITSSIDDVRARASEVGIAGIDESRDRVSNLPRPMSEKPEVPEEYYEGIDQAAEKAREKATEARASLEELIEGYRIEAETIGMTAEQRELYLAILEAEDIAREGNLGKLSAETQARIEQAVALKQSAEAEKELQEMMDRGTESADQIIKRYEERTKRLGMNTEELIRYNAEQEIATLLARDDIIVTEAQIAAIRARADALAKATTAQEILDEQTRKAQEQMDEAARQAQDFANVIGSAFEDAIINGEDLGDVLNALEQDILRILTRILITKPLENTLTGLLTGNGQDQSGGIFGPLGGIFGSIFGGGGGATPPIAPGMPGAGGPGGIATGGGGGMFGGLFSGLFSLFGSLFSGGGKVGVTSTQGVRMPASTWAGAPQAETGARMPNMAGAYPIIAHRGERILNAAETRDYESGGGGNRATTNIFQFQPSQTGNRMQDERNDRLMMLRARKDLGKAARDI